MSGDIERYLAVGAVLFVLGALGFLTRRNMIVMFLSAEMMLHGVSLTLVTFGRAHHSFEGQMFTIFILTVAACEAGLALALILALYQKSSSLDIDFWTELREADLPPPDDADKSRYVPGAPQRFPTLTPAGLVPVIRDVQDRNMVDDARSPTAGAPTEPPQPQDVIKTASR
jgi:NADH-quinone oxidoreductase subunit K